MELSVLESFVHADTAAMHFPLPRLGFIRTYRDLMSSPHVANEGGASRVIQEVHRGHVGFDPT